MKKFAEIAVELPIEGAFTYRIPDELKNDARLGKRALVPFGRRTITGYIIALTDTPPPNAAEAKDIIDLLDGVPIFDEKRLKFYKWMSSYYFSPIGEVLSLIHPGSANVKSARSLKPVEGHGTAEPAREFDREIYKAIGKGITAGALLKRFKGKPVFSAIERLKKDGLIVEELELKGGGSGKFERFVSIKKGVPPPVFKSSPARERVYNFLKDSGEISFSALFSKLGNVRDAVNRLHEKGLIIISERQVLRDPLSEIMPRAARFNPNSEQAVAIEQILKALGSDAFSPFLLYGVTGGGKTLVYLKILEEAVRTGKKAVILAPEIALTPWPAAYLADMFPGRVAIAHSGLSEGQRMDEWGRILRGEVDIVVGARSALFSPVKDLGLIIVDEEHETSYKQDDGVKYNARDAALMLGKYLGITVVLGSATPSVETFHNAKTGKITPLYIRKRVEERELPEIELLDMKGRKSTVISERLKSMMEEALNKSNQALLFLNRRGFSSSIICKDCGRSFECLNCSVTLTMHKGARVLKCHYCDMSIPIPQLCPDCHGTNLITPGAGTERVEEEIRVLFPEARVGRMDRDTTSRKGSAKKIIDSVEDKSLDVLIGTQMVSKGHHFPGITLVGVISGDTSLSIPDFRSSERTFQLITQAAGRAGRGAEPGRVVIQTLNPEHYCFRCASTHDYDSFFEEEIELRKELSYPPFTRLCNMRIEGLKEERVTSAIMELKAAGERLFRKKDLGITILGPAPALLARIKNRYRWQMLLKGEDVKTLHAAVSALKKAFEAKEFKGVSLSIDMDPVTMI